MTAEQILQDCKDEIAQKHGYENFKSLWNGYATDELAGNIDTMYAEAMQLYAQKIAELFAEWIADNYTIIRAAMMPDKWVNYKEHNVYTHGSDYHYSSLVSQFGKDTSVIYTEFLNQLNSKK